jgi:glycosyltransferase involved in cell wall biosynthesis
MKILYTMTSYPPATGGAQQHFHEIARRLQKTEQVQVVAQWRKNRQDWLLGSTLRAPEPQNDTIDGVPVQGLRFDGLDRLRMAPGVPFYYFAPQVFTPWIAPVFLKRLKEISFKPDIVHHGRIGRENLGFASLALARELKVPFVLTPFHHPRWVGWRYKKYLELYRVADHVFALTESERRTLISLGVAENRVSVLGHGPSVLPQADGQAFRAKYGIGKHPMVLFLGQKYAYKGFKALLQAAEPIWKKFPEARIVFVGPRTAESEKEFAQVKDPRIIELGAVALEEKCQALAACDLFILPSSQESFGGVYVEAWMYKKPVVGGRIAAIADVIDEGKNGLLTEQDPEEIASQAIEFLSNPEKSRLFGEAGYKKAVETYSWESICERARRQYLALL